MLSILDPRFKYTPSYMTDIRKTFDRLRTKVYKHCDTRCMKCRQCREFEALIDQIDLENKSELDRYRQANIEKRER